jgi:hypothetical protein
MERDRCLCTGPSPRAQPATRERASLFACGFLLRASARRCPSSCHPACPRQAWALDRAAPPLAPVGVAMAVIQAQQQADVVRVALRQVRAPASPVAPAAVRPVQAERPAVVGRPWAAPTAAAVVAWSVPGAQQLAAGRPSAWQRVVVAAPAPRHVVHAVERLPAVPPCCAAPETGLPVPVAGVAAWRPGAAPPVAAVPAAVLRVVRAALPFQVARPLRVARLFRVAPAAARQVPAARLAVERPGPASRVALAGAAARRVAGVLPPCHVARPFAVPVFVPPVRVAWFALAQRLASACPVRRKSRAPRGPFAHRIFRVPHPAWRQAPPAVGASSVALFASARQR